MTTQKIVLVAHHAPAVVERFCSALSEAGHTCLMSASEEVIRQAVQDGRRPLSLALIDLGLSRQPFEMVRQIRHAGRRAIRVVVFAGTVSSAADVLALAATGVAYVNEHAAPAQILPALAPHLFPDSFNRRATARIPIGLPVTFRVGQSVAGAVTLDIARTGLAIRTLNPLPNSTSVQLKFRLPGTSEIEAAARVVWSDPKVGMGVTFEKVSSNDQRLINAFMEGAVGELS
ncbi:MAG: PilZ domain-containing protein [Vicinamibacterales bacterium]